MPGSRRRLLRGFPILLPEADHLIPCGEVDPAVCNRRRTVDFDERLSVRGPARLVARAEVPQALPVRADDGDLRPAPRREREALPIAN